MEFSIGESVKYRYPNPLNDNEHFFIGKIESISDEFVFIKNEKNIRLKVSFKNFDYVSAIQDHPNQTLEYAHSV